MIPTTIINIHTQLRLQGLLSGTQSTYYYNESFFNSSQVSFTEEEINEVRQKLKEILTNSHLELSQRLLVMCWLIALRNQQQARLFLKKINDHLDLITSDSILLKSLSELIPDQSLNQQLTHRLKKIEILGDVKAIDSIKNTLDWEQMEAELIALIHLLPFLSSHSFDKALQPILNLFENYNSTIIEGILIALLDTLPTIPKTRTPALINKLQEYLLALKGDTLLERLIKSCIKITPLFSSAQANSFCKVVIKHFHSNNTGLVIACVDFFEQLSPLLSDKKNEKERKFITQSIDNLANRSWPRLSALEPIIAMQKSSLPQSKYTLTAMINWAIEKYYYSNHSTDYSSFGFLARQAMRQLASNNQLPTLRTWQHDLVQLLLANMSSPKYNHPESREGESQFVYLLHDCIPYLEPDTLEAVLQFLQKLIEKHGYRAVIRAAFVSLSAIIREKNSLINERIAEIFIQNIHLLSDSFTGETATPCFLLLLDSLSDGMRMNLFDCLYNLLSTDLLPGCQLTKRQEMQVCGALWATQLMLSFCTSEREKLLLQYEKKLNVLHQEICLTAIMVLSQEKHINAIGANHCLMLLEQYPTSLNITISAQLACIKQLLPLVDEDIRKTIIKNIGYKIRGAQYASWLEINAYELVTYGDEHHFVLKKALQIFSNDLGDNGNALAYILNFAKKRPEFALPYLINCLEDIPLCAANDLPAIRLEIKNLLPVIKSEIVSTLCQPLHRLLASKKALVRHTAFDLLCYCLSTEQYLSGNFLPNNPEKFATYPLFTELRQIWQNVMKPEVEISNKNTPFIKGV